MTNPDNKSFLERIVPYIIFSAITVLHFLLTFVVILLVLSTVNIINQSMLHFEKLDYFEIAISLCIFFASLIVFVKSFKKISLFVRQVRFKK
ncbi:MAG: hypothetical protein ABFR82_08225 [Nitrospirota bacterium]